MSALLKQMLADSPAGLWPLTDPSGTTAKDLSGNGRDGTYTNGTRLGASLGPIGLTNQGSSGSYVQISDNSAFSSHAGASGLMTAEAWYVPTLDGAFGSLYYCVSKAAAPYEFALSHRGSGEVFFPVWDSAGNDVTPAVLSTAAGALVTGKMSHIVGVYDRSASFMGVYVNGLLSVSTATFVGGRFSSDTSSVMRLFGPRGDGIGSSITTAQGFAAYYPTALSAARIKAHYEAGIRSGVSY